MSLNYPLNPDTSFESFFLTKDSDVVAALGQTFTQNQLAPMNYQKVMDACISGALTYAPVREFVHISVPHVTGRIGAEVTFNFQSINLKNVLVEAYNYWKVDLLGVSPFQCVGGVVSEITTRILTDSAAIPVGDSFQIETKLKINWLVVAAKSAYA
jgi:hypothetical protein